MKPRSLFHLALGALAALSVTFANPAAAQQTGSVTGTVVNAETGQPLAGVQVSVQGTRLGALTQQNGRFLILNVPVGTQTVVAQMIGFGTQRQENVRVTAEAAATVNFQLRTQALRLEEVVVTGVVDPVEGIKMPFSVGRVTAQEMPIPTTHSALAAIQGKVAGANIVRGGGQPGSGVHIMLRTPTSIVRSNSPMFVVDGVILQSSASLTSLDIESLDIESVEVVKGAAAAALYGSRAASGVISITTKRGTGIPTGTTRVTARSELGFSELPRGLPMATHHAFATDEQGNILNSAGEPDRNNPHRAPFSFMDRPYVTPLYDNVANFYQPGLFRTTSGSLQHNTESSQFVLSLNSYQERGTIPTNDGFIRNNFRMNLTHRASDRLNFFASAYHNRGTRDNLSGDPFWDLLMYPPDVNLGQKDEHGNYIQQPDPTIVRENPLWRQTSRDNGMTQLRTLLSGQVNYSPLHWLRFDTNLSYDRMDRNSHVYVPKGTPMVSSAEEPVTADGQLSRTEVFTDVFNASASAHLRFDFGRLNSRTTFRGIMEREEYTDYAVTTTDFHVVGVPRMNVAQNVTASSWEQAVRANGFMVDQAFDYDGRYIASALVRRDGSSLFGPDARWATYYRFSGAWLMARESWWPFAAINEFKPRYSIGTSGGRPGFSDQYETWSVSSSGAVSKSTLGNRNLRPEHTTEQEFGLDIIALDRYQLELTYARQQTDHQIVQIPQPALSGYSNQWQNSGQIKGHTYEATLQALLVQRPNFNWNATLIADRSRSRISEWNRVCYFTTLGIRCGGANLTEIWGDRLLRGHDELPEWLSAHGNQFQVNDEGWLVAVGDGSYRDGRWGETVEIGGRTYQWGMPVREVDEAGNAVISKIGEGNADLNLGLINQFRMGGVTLHTHLQAKVGGDIYNATKQRLYQHLRHGDLDQAGKPEDLKKPVEYYHALYNTNNVTNSFVEDASYLKLRELALTYTVRPELLSRIGLGWTGADRMTLGLIGRNLLTMTSYTGFDPEVGSIVTPQDNFAWPNTRHLTANIEISF